MKKVFLAIALFLIASTAHAQIKLTAPLNAWDRNSGRWENGNVQLWSDPNIWVPFYEELNFDNADFNTSGYGPACTGPDDVSTPLAGELEIGLYHTDNNPPGAPGFQATRNWLLADCAVIEALTDPFTTPPPPSTLDAALWRIGNSDVVEPGYCGGNCTDEIVNRFFVSLDADCDGVPNPLLPPRVCIYWEAQPPAMGNPTWNGNIQARINSIVDGVSVGDKTLNFSVYGPTAVELQSLVASGDGMSHLISSIVIALLIVASIGLAVLSTRE